MSTKPNAAAYPRIAVTPYGTRIEDQPGLTKREYFAAMAMQGLISAAHLYDSVRDDKSCAIMAVKMADALMEALNKTE